MNQPNKPELKIPVECYTRVCGFYRPVSQFNPGKQSEFNDRVYSKLPDHDKLKDIKK